MFNILALPAPNMGLLALTLAIGYALGAIPFGILLTKFTGAGDLRSIGSGNIGATNVLRTGRKGLAAATLLLDLAKGAVAILIVRHYFPGYENAAALGAFLGHLYPIWLRFRGGKGVATLAGIAFALYCPLGLAFAALWLGLLAALRISSLAGISAAIAMPLGAWLLGKSAIIGLFLLTMTLVLWKHKDNIRRLAKGTEPRIGGNI